MNDIQRGREVVEIKTYPEMNKKIPTLLRMDHDDEGNPDKVSYYAAQLIEELEAKAARGERIEAAARKTVKYECWADPRFDYYEKFCRGCECEWICQALGGE